MNRTTFFPALLIVLMVCAGAAYGYAGEWRRCIYWLCAAGLNAAITF